MLIQKTILAETLKLLKQLLHFIWKHYEIILQNFCETEIIDVNNQKDEKLHATERLKKQYEQENESLHGKLKVHYAYQNNRLLLDLLLKDVDKLKQKLNIQDVYDWFDNYKARTSYLFSISFTGDFIGYARCGKRRFSKET